MPYGKQSSNTWEKQTDNGKAEAGKEPGFESGHRKDHPVADEQRFGGNQHPADRLFHNLLHGYTGPECGYRRNHLHGQKAGGRRHGSPRGHPDRQDADPLEERASL